MLASASCSGCRTAMPRVPADGTAVAPRREHIINMPPFVDNALRFQYHFVTEVGGTEAALCMYGNRRNDTTFVRRLEHPFIFAAAPHSISFGCRPENDYLGSIHTHNWAVEENRPCQQSPLDLLSFSRMPDKISAVYCGPEGGLDIKVKP